MPRVEAEDLQDAIDIYLASTLREARGVEKLLTGHGINYVVQVEPLGRSTLFGSLRHGAAFFVAAGQAAYCRTLLIDAGFERGVIREDDRRAPADGGHEDR
jgi:hypothetical protein